VQRGLHEADTTPQQRDMDGNGAMSSDGNQKTPQMGQILHALEIVHNPRTSNSLRQEASRYLEDVRSNEEAPYHGFGLASTKDQSAIVRHYGLSLLDYAIRHRWSDYTAEQSKQLRDWVLELAFGAHRQDPPYLKNKIAEAWVELAKRSWGVDWMDMDEALNGLWEGLFPQKMLALTILEALSDEVFGTEDTVTALRGNELTKACVVIFTPVDVLSEEFPTRESSNIIRHVPDGWISSLSLSLETFLREQAVDDDSQFVAAKTLSALRSIVTWAIPGALVFARTVDRVCACLAVSEMSVQLVSMFPESISLDSISNL